MAHAKAQRRKEVLAQGVILETYFGNDAPVTGIPGNSNEIRIGDFASFVIGGAGNDVLIGTAGNDNDPPEYETHFAA